jgi:hypothetical protein
MNVTSCASKEEEGGRECKGKGGEGRRRDRRERSSASAADGHGNGDGERQGRRRRRRRGTLGQGQVRWVRGEALRWARASQAALASAGATAYPGCAQSWGTRTSPPPRTYRLRAMWRSERASERG